MRTDTPRSRRALTAVLASAALALAGCVPEPGPTPSSTGDPSPAQSTPGATPSASASADAGAGDDIALPARCEDIYSADMLATLTEQNPPLNDPGVTMYSSQIVEALEVIESGAPSIRCSWGVPSEVGLATNVTIVDTAQATLLRETLPAKGLVCEEAGQGTLCTMSGTNDVADFGETHYLRGNGWISTHWINYDPEGYTDDIVGMLWG
ncbi:MAG: hypothetical protein DI573_10630 [Microbacterium sp.]|uniref:hypothetical protein n=1 Tax=unclassified Microbacterium TaxID=2609290 RepID=UPI000DB385A3|nr:hypothetical protein [Microbacterium sp.]PZU37985.1 MAG: hypothetical protein DI573_10630 [Microbacterium sp.]